MRVNSKHGFDESSLRKSKSVSPEQNRLLTSYESSSAMPPEQINARSPDELSRASTLEKKSPVHCKHLPRKPEFPTPNETRTPGMDTTSDNLEFESFIVITSRDLKVNSAEISSSPGHRSQRYTAEKQKVFLPAWRRKSMDKIQTMKLQREGACLIRQLGERVV